jgi:tetratricopeptide (TPR) repeat protein
MTKLRLLAAALLTAGVLGAAHAAGVTPAVGKPLKEAGDLLRAGNAKGALAKIAEAERAPGKNAYDQCMIDRVKGSAAQRAGDNGMAATAFESALSGGCVPSNEQGQLAESIAFSYSAAKNYAKASQWVTKAQSMGANSPNLKQLQTYLQTQGGDYSGVLRTSQAAVDEAERGGRRPAEDDLLRLADAQFRMGNKAGQFQTLEKLVTYYPKKEYWNTYLGRVQAKPGFSDRFGFDVLRVKLATGNMADANDYMELSQLALQDGLGAEGKAVMDKGFAAGVLGTGAPNEVSRQQRLRDLANKTDAEARATLDKRTKDAQAVKGDGNALVAIGREYVGMGQVAQGVALIQEGIEKDKLKRPEDAKLRLGAAMLLDPKTKAKGIQILKTVQGTDGVADVAHMYIVLGSSQ